MDIKEKILEVNNKNFSKEDRKKYIKMNVHDIISQVKTPFDSNAVAQRCYEKYYNIEGHKYFHMTKNEILESWNNKTQITKKLGNQIDSYIQLLLEKDEKALKLWKLDQDYMNDVPLKAKCEAVNILLGNFKKLNFEFKLREIPLYQIYNDYIFSGKEDSIFESKDRYILVDWKSSVVTTENQYGSKLLGPMKNYDDCKLIEYTLQILFYKYFLIHSYGITDKPIDPYIIEFKLKDDPGIVGEYYVHKPAFEYDEDFLNSIFNYAIEKHKIITIPI